MKALHLVLAAGTFLALSAFAGAEPPQGFEAPGLLARLLNGEIVIEEKISTSTEFKDYSRAYFNKVDAEAYLALAVNHPHYADLFEEVASGETLKVSEDRTKYDYRLHMIVEVGPFSKEFYPEGQQVLFRATDAVSESRIENSITNYKEYLKMAQQNTRLIPYQGGLLVEDSIHFQLVKPSGMAGMVKSKMKEFFNKYVVQFRKELQGDH